MRLDMTSVIFPDDQRHNCLLWSISQVNNATDDVQTADDILVSKGALDALEQPGWPFASASGVARSIEVILEIPFSSTARVFSALC